MSKIRKKILLIITIFLLVNIPSNSYFDISTPVEGESIANDALQKKVIEKIYKEISPQISTCSNFSIENTQILHYPYDIKKKKNKIIKGYWKELWTLNACNEIRQIPITFYIDYNNTTFNIDEYFLLK